MDRFACELIDALGGTAAVARLSEGATSTVHNMRRRLTSSRLNHLRRIASDEMPSLDVAALAARHGLELPPIPTGKPAALEMADQSPLAETN